MFILLQMDKEWISYWIIPYFESFHIQTSTWKCQRLFRTLAISNDYIINTCYVIEKSTIMVKYNKR